jgi:hypothetical protein
MPNNFEEKLQAARALVKTLQHSMSERDRLRREGGSAAGYDARRSRQQLSNLDQQLNSMESDLTRLSRNPSNYGM